MAYPNVIYIYQKENDPNAIWEVVKNLEDIPRFLNGEKAKVGKYTFTAKYKVKIVVTEEAE